MMFTRQIKSFVVRSGRMSRAQSRSYESGKDQFIIPYTDGFIEPGDYFGNENPVTVEIGFGMGSATAGIAEKNPQNNYIGIEVFRDGIGRLLWEIGRRNLENIRIIEHDAAEVLEHMIRPESLAAVHVFFPDPWPKRKHHKRRLIKRPFTELLASRLESGAYLYMVTDWADYGNSALAELSATRALENSAAGFAPRRAWRPLTKFEKKGLDKNHPIRELYFYKKG
ncbi:MAG: tRNA (guanosine(46)-N7)-methyltransferase TrmB [Treponema sp.]|jgi:tRNA (guanine-N7-)-methyltransferase|nr:tRNA (guanosine(46)-N7)-methyltransferase TrmB [Treponema sp.]